LFADESITNDADFSLLKEMFNGVNIKLMKAGSYYNSIRLLKEAKANNLQTMIGCMVETTLGITSAMNLCSVADYADLDSLCLIRRKVSLAVFTIFVLKFIRMSPSCIPALAAGEFFSTTATNTPFLFSR